MNNGNKTTLEFMKFSHQLVEEDYFNLNSIFAQNTNVSCLFESKTPHG